jgi:acyl carrier protein phosphodiesterase
MNYLAHAYLAFDNPSWLVGQFIADAVKGNKYRDYPDDIRNGILLHRFVDSYTDTFPACLELRSHLRADLGLFTPIAMDVFFDHILAREWTRFSRKLQEDFIADVYKVLGHHAAFIPSRMKFFISRMQEHNWLARYKTMDGIALTLNQMAIRMPKGEVLARAPEVLQDNIKKINETFEIFFPQLISATEIKIDTFAT